MSNNTRGVLAAVHMERLAQDEKWGEQNHPNFMPDEPWNPYNYQWQAQLWKSINDERCARKVMAWDSILLEEVYEALTAEDEDEMRAELIQTAAVAVAWIQAIDRRKAKGK